jgi:hypothetical protein
MRLVTVLALLLLVGFCTAPAIAGEDPVKDEGDPRLPVDYDYYQINLTAGVQVIIETMASPVCDPDVGDTKLYLYGPGSCTTQVGYNDDISYPSNNYSRITYTPTATGVFYIKAQGYSSTYLGCYKMTITCAGVVPTTLVNEIEPNDTCGATVQLLTCDNYVHGQIGGIPGACCNPSTGGCTLTEQSSCLAPSIWHGEWTACSPNPCPQPPSGACCATDGHCTVTIQSSCVSPSVWHGEWTSCSPNNCPGAQQPPVNDTCAGAIPIPCGTGTLTGDIGWANNDYDPGVGTPPASCTGYAAVGADVVYVVNLVAGDVVTFVYTPTPTSWDAAIYLVTDCSNVNDSCVAGRDAGNPETLTWTVTNTGTYWLICDKYGASIGDGFTLQYTIPCPPVYGACCAPDGSCTLTVQTACAAPSVWHVDWPSCQPINPCPVPAVCCYLSGDCVVTLEALCVPPAIWHPEWLSCAPDNPCPQPPAEAACCFTDGHCEYLTEEQCMAAPDHTVWMVGTTCLPGANPCAQPGACCDPATGVCTMVVEALCVQPRVFVGGDCLPTNPCPQPGACCDPVTGACAFVLQPACPTGWLWLVGVPCVPNNPCPPPIPTAACCDVLGNCTVTTQAACLAPSVWHPEWPTCVPNNCPPPVPTESSTWGKIKANYR